MDINVKVTIGAEPELIMHLATLVECVKDVLKVSNSQLAAAEPVKAEPPKKKAKPHKERRNGRTVSENTSRSARFAYLRKMKNETETTL